MIQMQHKLLQIIELWTNQIQFNMYINDFMMLMFVFDEMLTNIKIEYEQ
jgi:hypothetical protein